MILSMHSEQQYLNNYDPSLFEHPSVTVDILIFTVWDKKLRLLLIKRNIYPFYGSDVEATLKSGNDLRHGLIGAGVYASHGYERSHRDGAENTLKLLIEYAL